MIFHADKQRGSHLFALYFAALTIPADTRARVTAQFLGVTQKTLALWLSGKREPPPAAVAVLWHECKHGRAALDSHSHQGMLYARGIADCLRSENSALREIIVRLESEIQELSRARAPAHTAANSSIFAIPGANYRAP